MNINTWTQTHEHTQRHTNTDTHIYMYVHACTETFSLHIFKQFFNVLKISIVSWSSSYSTIIYFIKSWYTPKSSKRSIGTCIYIIMEFEKKNVCTCTYTCVLHVANTHVHVLYYMYYLNIVQYNTCTLYVRLCKSYHFQCDIHVHACILYVCRISSGFCSVKIYVTALSDHAHVHVYLHAHVHVYQSTCRLSVWSHVLIKQCLPHKQWIHTFSIRRSNHALR